jgi:hypothetical protein
MRLSSSLYTSFFLYTGLIMSLSLFSLLFSKIFLTSSFQSSFSVTEDYCLVIVFVFLDDTLIDLVFLLDIELVHAMELPGVPSFK